jgi:hypothetical protein
MVNSEMDMSYFVDALRDLIDDRGLTIAKVASKCGCTYSRIDQALRGVPIGHVTVCSIIKSFELWDDPAMLRRILIGFLLQKFPLDCLEAAELVRPDDLKPEDF